MPSGALIVGFQRALFSNEAGIGSAAIAHSAVRTRHPVTEGLVALLEPFIDTVVVCAMTALTIVIASTPSWEQARAAVSTGADAPEGVTLTSDAFATVLSWAYYGQKAWQYLFGRGRVAGLVYKFVVCGFVLLGAVLMLDAVVSFMDAMMFVLAFINIAGLYLLALVVKRELADFAAKVAAGHFRRGGRSEVELRE